MEFKGQEHTDADEMGVGSALHGASFSGNRPGRYQECLRNHATAQVGHVVDGCGEFMTVPTGDEHGGSGAHALRCAACGCHRSFHRKDDGQHYQQHHRSPLLPAPATPRVPLLLPPPHPYAGSNPHVAPPPFPYHHQPLPHHQQKHTPSGGTTTESSSEDHGLPASTSAAQAQGEGRRKRFRTKFMAEQKEQMLALAERLGWHCRGMTKPWWSTSARSLASDARSSRSVPSGHYAVEIYFDPVLENQVLKAWNVLARRQLRSRLIDTASRPHLPLLHLPAASSTPRPACTSRCSTSPPSCYPTRSASCPPSACLPRASTRSFSRMRIEGRRWGSRGRGALTGEEKK